MMREEKRKGKILQDQPDFLDSQDGKGIFYLAISKLELIYRRQFATRAEAQTEIFGFVKGFSNRSRLHSFLNYLSPVDFETKNN
jgi:transposase InsO family protein